MGSVSGVPDAYIVIDNGTASDEEACEIKPSWGAAVCRGDFGRLSLGGGFGFGGGAPVPECDGRWLVVPGFTTAAAGAEQSSLAALRDASDTSYCKDDDTLWVKLVVANTGGGGGRGGLGGGTSIEVSR